jgi:hypothetical protein
MTWTMALSAMPLWQSGFLVVGLGTIFGMAGPVMLRHLLGIDRLKINNEVAGFKFAVVGVIYAVLLGFATVVTWEKFRDADVAVLQESAALVALNRLTDGVEQPAADQIKVQLQAYIHAVIQEDWPAMNQGGFSRLVSKDLDGLYRAVIAHEQHGPGEVAILQEMLGQLDTVTQARRTRLALAAGIIPSVVWVILFSGAFITVVFTFFFGSTSLAAQVLMNGLLSALVFIALWVIAEINFPFTGPVQVSKYPLAVLLDEQ